MCQSLRLSQGEGEGATVADACKGSRKGLCVSQLVRCRFARQWPIVPLADRVGPAAGAPHTRHAHGRDAPARHAGDERRVRRRLASRLLPLVAPLSRRSLRLTAALPRVHHTFSGRSSTALSVCCARIVPEPLFFDTQLYTIVLTVLDTWTWLVVMRIRKATRWLVGWRCRGRWHAVARHLAYARTPPPWLYPPANALSARTRVGSVTRIVYDRHGWPERRARRATKERLFRPSGAPLHLRSKHLRLFRLCCGEQGA